MKKIYTFFISAALYCTSSAQLTQANHAPVAGDTYTMIGVDVTGIDPGAAGTGVTWDFSGHATNTVVQNYTAVASGDPDFPNASVEVGFDNNNKSYYDSDNSALYYYGGDVEVQGNKAALNYTAPAVKATYTMGMGSSTTAVTGGSLTFSSQNGDFTGTSHATADATGTLVLSTGTFTNVLRVVTSETLNIDAGLPAKLTMKTYEYYGSLKTPLFTIVSGTLNFLGSDNMETIALRNKEAVSSNTVVSGLGLSQNTATIKIFPQPAGTDLVFANLPQGSDLIKIYDITGKQVQTIRIRDEHVKLDVSSHQQGLYMFSVSDAAGNILHNGKFTVVH